MFFRKSADRFSRSPFRRPQRRAGGEPVQSIEALESRVIPGSLIPTETGTAVGHLLPVEQVELLARSNHPDLSPADIALQQADREMSSVQEVMRWLDQPRHQQQAEQTAQRILDESGPTPDPTGTSRDESSGEGTHPQNPDHRLEHQSETEAGEIDEPLELSSEELLAGLAIASESAGENESDDDPDGEAGTEETTTPRKSKRTSHAGEDDDTATAVRSGSSTGSSQAIDLTFAGSSGPGEAARQCAGYFPVSGGGGDRSSGTGGAGTGALPVAGSSTNGESTGSSQTDSSSTSGSQPVVVRYDFRSIAGYTNEFTAAQQSAAELALRNWENALDGQIVFERDTQAPDSEVVILYLGQLEAFGHESTPGEVLGLGGTVAVENHNGSIHTQRVIALDRTENYDISPGNGNPVGTYDLTTVVGHEMGHVLGIEDASATGPGDIMNQVYDVERSPESYHFAANTYLSGLDLSTPGSTASLHGLHAMITGYPQLSQAEVQALLAYASQVSPSEDAIIAIVDRGGNILGVRVEAGVDAGLQADPQLRTFAIDGAVAKARTAAFFANGDPQSETFAPITSRLVRFISQSTVSFREVNSNPNSADPNVRGPGFVAPIGVGGHFPPEIAYTPPVDLFAIEHTNRDSIVHPGEDGVKGTADDITLRSRFNIDPAFVPFDSDGDGMVDNPDTDSDGLANLRLSAPESYGFVSGLYPQAQARGIATLPGGVPLYRDTNGDGIGDTIIGGVGVFFPGPDGTADFEQGFVAGVGQTESQRTNASRVLEAEFIAVVTAGGSKGAAARVPGAEPPVHPVPTLDIPFGRLDLVGIQLEVIGPTPGILGVEQLVNFGTALGPLTGANSGADQQVTTGGDLYQDGQSVPYGYLVTPHDGGDFDADGNPDITAAQVQQIIENGIAEANSVRAAIRLPIGSRTRMVFAVTDRGGNVLGLFRMRDATIFSIDVAIAKARNTAYYADATALQPIDQVTGVEGTVPAGTAFTNRTIRFLAEPRYPSGQDGRPAGDFSILNDLSAALGIPTGGTNDVQLVESNAVIPASAFNSVLGHDAFVPGTNFRDPGDGAIATGDPLTDRRANQNGIVFFPGSTPLYGNAGGLIGGFGVSGDGVDQDDVVTFSGAQGFLPPDAVIRADEVVVDNVRLPYIKFLRNPRG